MPAAPYTLPLAVAASITLADPGLLIWLLFLMTVPLTILGAVRLGRHIGLNRTVRVWGAVTYGFLPVLTGAVGGGRLGAIVIALLLPWVATAAWRLDARSTDRRRRALWRTVLGIGLLGCFMPVFFLAGLALALTARRLPTRLERSERCWLAVGPLVFVIPWLPAVLAHPQLLMFEAGLARPDAAPPGVLDLFALNDGGSSSAPWWLTLAVPVLAVVALARPQTRRRVMQTWIVVAVAAVVLAVFAHVAVSLPGSAAQVRPPLNALLIAIGAAMVLGIATAANGIWAQARQKPALWRPVVAALCLVALVVPVGGGAWWVSHGTQGPLHRADDTGLPAYLVDLAAASPKGATLVLSGSRAGALDPTVHYSVFRGDGLRTADDSVLAATRPDPVLRASVARLIGPTSAGVADHLATRGIGYVFMAAPVSSAIAGAVDATAGFTAASAPDPRTRAWNVTVPTSLSALPTGGHWFQRWLVVGEVLALIAILVLVVPGRRAR